MVRTRLAVMQDWAILYSWRNDPETRVRFSSKQVVTLKDHLIWLGDTLNNPKMHLYIGYDSEHVPGAIGQIRLDVYSRGPKKWGRCSITVAPNYRGRGYGNELVAQMVHRGKELNLTGLLAEIENDNYASLRSFAANEFHTAEVGDTMSKLERRL